MEQAKTATAATDKDKLTTLRLQLQGDTSNAYNDTLRCPWNLGPLLQGVLMESIDSSYAAYLHALAFNPYSQYCLPGAINAEQQNESGNEKCVTWVIHALNQEAYQYLIKPLSRLKDISLKKCGVSLGVINSEQTQVSRTELTALIYNSTSNRHKIRFITPTSFKSGGCYQNIPSVRLIFQNLLMHYGQAYDGEHELESDTLDYVQAHVRIMSYSLSSRVYTIGGSKIPAFTGVMTIEANGAKPLNGLVHMLCSFSEYSGIGIKTAMGMGGVNLLES